MRTKSGYTAKVAQAEGLGASVEAERRLAKLRLAVMTSATILLPFVQGRPTATVWLAYTLLCAGWLYSVWLVWREPFRRHTLLTSAMFTTAADSILTLVWVYATGGATSPWVVALYSVVAYSAFRFSAKHTFFCASLCAAGYVAGGALTSQLTGHATDVVVRVLYLFLIAAVGTILAQERTRELASRVRLLDMTQAMAQIGSWEWVVADDVVRWSDELYRVFGLPQGEVPNLSSYMAAIAPEDRQRVAKVIADAREQKTAFRVDHRIVRPDGTIRWLHCRGRVLLDENGDVREMVGSAQDITERHEMQRQLVFPNKLASLGTLASGIAHEIRNPLAYVANNLEIIERHMKDPAARAELEQAVTAARHGSARVREIVRGLGTFARAEDDVRGPVDAARAADVAISMIMHEASTRARVVRDYRDVPRVHANESRLSQVLLNLLVNAAQAIEPGAADHNVIRVAISARADGRVAIEVSDTGSGIADSIVERIFDPFFTTKAAGEGTGLGLAICQGIIQDLDGDISVETAMGQGTTFRVLLPAIQAASSRPSGDLRRKRILVIDDEVRHAESLRLLLGDVYDVKVTTQGNVAVDLIASGERFDVVLCDLTMSPMNGMEVHVELGRIAPEHQARMIFLTGGATTDDTRAFLALATVRHLEKPVAFPDLEAALRDVIAGADVAAA